MLDSRIRHIEKGFAGERQSIEKLRFGACDQGPGPQPESSVKLAVLCEERPPETHVWTHRACRVRHGQDAGLVAEIALNHDAVPAVWACKVHPGRNTSLNRSDQHAATKDFNFGVGPRRG